MELPLWGRRSGLLVAGGSALALLALWLPSIDASALQHPADPAFTDPASSASTSISHHSLHRHLLQFSAVVKDETPQQQMERMRREIQVAKRQQTLAEQRFRQGGWGLDAHVQSDIKFAVRGLYRKRKVANRESTRNFGEDGPLGVLPPVREANDAQ